MRAIDETGHRYGKLTVLKRDGSINGAAAWLCLCDCGNQTRVRGIDLRDKRPNHGTKSCGCLITEKNGADEAGKRYGNLVVLERAGVDPKDRLILWKCQCDCGNVTIVKGRYLRNGDTISCGCKKNSWREFQIENFLKQNNVNYRREFIFPDLRDKNLLRFDFAIFDGKGQLSCLIEHQGKQHVETEDNWYSNTLEKHDKMKKEYCKEHDIPLFEIFYYDNLNNKMNEIMRYLENGA